MVDEVAAAPVADEKPVASVVPPPAGKEPDAGTGKATGATNGGGLGAEAAKGDEVASEAHSGWWQEDWRSKYTKDPGRLGKLNRYASPKGVLDAFFEQDRKISAGELLRTLSERPTDSEIAAFHEVHGIPKEPTVEAYGTKWPDNYTPTESDKADLSAIVAEAHAGHESPKEVQKWLDRYVRINTKAAEDLQVAAAQKSDENKAEIRSQFVGINGRLDRDQFDQHQAEGKRFIREHLGERGENLVSLTLADGTKIGDHPLFWELYTKAGMATASDRPAPDVNGVGGGASFDQQYREALALGDTDAKAYHSPEHQAKLMRMAAQKAARESRKVA